MKCETCENYKRHKLIAEYSNSGEEEYLESGSCELLLKVLQMSNSDLIWIKQLTIQSTFSCCFYHKKKVY
jgi:hypothetical protein